MQSGIITLSRMFMWVQGTMQRNAGEGKGRGNLSDDDETTYIQLKKRNRERGDEKDEKVNIKIGESGVFRYSYKKRNTGKCRGRKNQITKRSTLPAFIR